MKTLLMTAFALAALCASGAGATTHAARRSIPGASLGRHYIPHGAAHHAARAKPPAATRR
jgi:hypothetical protein